MIANAVAFAFHCVQLVGLTGHPETVGAGALRTFLTCAGSTPTFRKYSCVERANGTDALQFARSYLAVPKL